MEVEEPFRRLCAAGNRRKGRPGLRSTAAQHDRQWERAAYGNRAAREHTATQSEPHAFKSSEILLSEALRATSFDCSKKLATFPHARNEFPPYPCSKPRANNSAPAVWATTPCPVV